MGTTNSNMPSGDDQLNSFAQLEARLKERQGLTRREQALYRGAIMAEFNKQKKVALTDFIHDNIRRKECINFVPKDPKRQQTDPIKCHCGEVVEKHYNFNPSSTYGWLKKNIRTSPKVNKGEHSSADDRAGEKWEPETSIREFPTDAFGKIDFMNEGVGGHKPAKFVRLSDKTPAEKVLDLMIRHWRMLYPSPPRLVITVIGGAKNFKLDGKKKDIFNKGLINAASMTNAWIITGGCNMGVMKAVGEAVAEGQSYTWDGMGMTHSLRCIGIAPWGYIEGHDNLIKKEGSWNATYKVNHVIEHNRPVPLNHNHTHFLLVDNGRRKRFCSTADFRASLEELISSASDRLGQEDAESGVPVVLLLVEGGYDAFKDVLQSLNRGIPTVICNGTGRAADIMAFAFKHISPITTNHDKDHDKMPMEVVHEEKLRKMLVKEFGKTWEDRSNLKDETEKYMNMIKECCNKQKLITVFDMNRHGDLDLAILSALLKPIEGQEPELVNQLHDQLKLAISWNRSDIAEEKIFNNCISWPNKLLHSVMTQALVEDKMNFVRLLLQNGVIMHDYLTVPMLRALYNYAPKTSHLRKKLTRYANSDKFSLQHVQCLLRKLFGKHTDVRYSADTKGEDLNYVDDSYTQRFPKPYRELFLWAVLMNRLELAKFLWERVDEAIPSAIAASKIYNTMAETVAEYESELVTSYRKNKREFENLAILVLEECQNTDPEKATCLLERKCNDWGGLTCLQMAAAADDKAFLSTLCCQNLIQLMWKRGISSHWPKMVLCLLFFPLIFCWLRFRHGEKNISLTPWEKLEAFYRAPCIRFTTNLMMYLVFLAVYSYMLLFEFRPEIRILEMIVLAWMGTFLIEDIREMLFRSNADALMERISDWWNFNFFSKLELAIFIIAVSGVVLRFITFPRSFIISKTLYAINCIFFFVRALKFYSASSYLGPKLVMITKMMQELMFYLVILLVFLLGYGVSINAAMYPIRDFYPNIFRDIFYYPTWQITGELFLEEMEGASPECQFINGTKMTSDGELCPEFNALVPVLTAAYLLMGNVLLLNLLIAIFSNIFEEVQENSMAIWKYGRYLLLLEFRNKPILAPPFIIIEHLLRTIRFIILCPWCCYKKEKKKDTQRWSESLEIFEKEMTRSYIRKRDRRMNNVDIEVAIDHIQNSMDYLVKHLEEEKNNSHGKTLCHQESSLDYSSYNSCQCRKATRSPSNRWPSLEKIRMVLKEEKDELEEHCNPGNKSDTASDPSIEDNTQQRNGQSGNGIDNHSKHVTDKPGTLKTKVEEEAGDGNEKQMKQRRASFKNNKDIEVDHEDEDGFQNSGMPGNDGYRNISSSSDDEIMVGLETHQRRILFEQQASFQSQLSDVNDKLARAADGLTACHARMNSMEEQYLETHRSISNMEELLKNVVFSRSLSTPPGSRPDDMELITLTPRDQHEEPGETPRVTSGVEESRDTDDLRLSYV